jgi:ribosomal protein S18 acetylase RimI-like enzyme
MIKFPVDAPKKRVVKTLESLGFQIVREREPYCDDSGRCRRNQNAFDNAESFAD